jgi:hypothetical protein
LCSSIVYVKANKQHLELQAMLTPKQEVGTSCIRTVHALAKTHSTL